jgi:hypothetical protein
MSILDDAIREHLELKRAHGADESELKKLEDEAFGPPGRPGEAESFTEAPTEFLGEAAIGAKEAAEEAQGDSGRRAPNIADLQEPPPAPPSDEEQPAAEQTIPVPHPEGEIESGPTTEEREAIAEQPTEFFDVEAELESSAEPSPTDDQLLDSQLAEPRLAPADPLSAVDDTGPDAEVARPPALEDDDDEFFSEQRLSDELDRALEAPITDEHEAPSAEHEVISEEHEAISEEHEVPPPAPATDEHAEDEGDSPDDVYEPETGSHDDVLEDTPEFLEDKPEDEDLWFEQKPPKDFDFDD